MRLDGCDNTFVHRILADLGELSVGQRVEARMHAYEMVLRGIAGLMIGSASVARQPKIGWITTASSVEE